ncbi:MAG: hypothetical protein INF81_17755 [Roseomonas sp.]|jgi:hypothetical protein|nr:hypothetical protein [Roseomonas sp.]MCA3430313.1 hypothetical protein [Roseomonas sp.]MCA3435272.1 hypothetical protein [Roseomonas sp.]MCZ8277745.1 hypothetical protein [Acetobacteraceae bacterium]
MFDLPWRDFRQGKGLCPPHPHKARAVLIGKEVSRRPFAIFEVYETAQAKAPAVMTKLDGS